MTGCFILSLYRWWSGWQARRNHGRRGTSHHMGRTIRRVSLSYFFSFLFGKVYNIFMNVVFVYKVDGKVCKTCIISSYAGYFHVSRHCVFTFLDDICFIDIVTWISNECLARLGTVYSHGISPKMSYVTTVVLGNIHLFPIPLKYPQ